MKTTPELGTATLLAALGIATAKVIADCKRRHRHQEFLAFLAGLEGNVPAHLDVHLILDNCGTHKHRKAKAWLGRHPRFHLHFTPTYASWLTQVERWFALGWRIPAVLPQVGPSLDTLPLRHLSRDRSEPSS